MLYLTRMLQLRKHELWTWFYSGSTLHSSFFLVMSCNCITPSPLTLQQTGVGRSRLQQGYNFWSTVASYLLGCKLLVKLYKVKENKIHVLFKTRLHRQGIATGCRFAVVLNQSAIISPYLYTFYEKSIIKYIIMCGNTCHNDSTVAISSPVEMPLSVCHQHDKEE